MTSKQQRHGERLVVLVRLAIAAALLAAMFFFVPFDQLLRAISSVTTPTLIAAVVAGLLVQVSVALRVHPLLQAQGLEFTVTHVLAVNLSTSFYGLALPGGNLAGILVRLHRFGGPQANYSGAVVMLVFDRLLATGSMCAVGAVAWLVDWPETVWTVFALMIVALLIIVAVPLALTSDLLLADRVVKLPGRRLRESAARLAAALESARRLPRNVLIRVSILALVGQFLGTLVYWFVATGLGTEISLTTMMWVRSAALLVATIPISIAGLGVREGAFVVLLAGFGISGAEGAAISLTGFAATTGVAAVLGAALEALRISRPRDGL